MQRDKKSASIALAPKSQRASLPLRAILCWCG